MFRSLCYCCGWTRVSSLNSIVWVETFDPGWYRLVTFEEATVFNYFPHSHEVDPDSALRWRIPSVAAITPDEFIDLPLDTYHSLRMGSMLLNTDTLVQCRIVSQLSGHRR